MTICPTHRMPMDIRISLGPDRPANMCEFCWNALLYAELTRIERTMRRDRGDKIFNKWDPPLATPLISGANSA